MSRYCRQWRRDTDRNPAIAWLLMPLASTDTRCRIVIAAAVAYAALFAVLLVQAMNGHPLVPMVVSR